MSKPPLSSGTEPEFLSQQYLATPMSPPSTRPAAHPASRILIEPTDITYLPATAQTTNIIQYLKLLQIVF